MNRFKSSMIPFFYLMALCLFALALPGNEIGAESASAAPTGESFILLGDLFADPLPAEEPPTTAEPKVEGAGEEKKAKVHPVKKLPTTLPAVSKLPTVYPLPGSTIYTYDSLTAELHALKNSYPDLITLSSIGNSVEGRNLWSVSLGRGARRILIVGACHAREWLTSALLVKMIQTYAAADRSGSSLDGYPVRGVLDQYTLLFVPMQNPDGVTLAQFGLSAFPEEKHARLLAMKPDRSDNFTRWKANLNGVDLNRQHQAGSGGWARYKDNVGGTPQKPWFENYPGTSPETEPESRAIASLIRQGNFDAVLTFHSSGNIFFWYYFQDRSSSTIMSRDRKIVQALSDYSGYGNYNPASVNWNAGAHLTAWVVHDLKIPCITVEIGAFTTGYLKMSDLPGIWARTKAVPLVTAQALPGYRNCFVLQCRVAPPDGGKVTGAGSYPYAAAFKVRAVPEQHYAFVSWTENGRVIGNAPDLSIQLTADRTLTANFEPVEYEVAVSISPEEGGSAAGAGLYRYGSGAVLTAVPAEGYAFDCWMEDDLPLDESAKYTFTVGDHRSLTACFTKIPGEGDDEAAAAVKGVEGKR